MSGIFCYAPNRMVDEYIKLGWEPRGALKNTYHGQYSTYMEWTKDEEPIMPIRDHLDAASEA